MLIVCVLHHISYFLHNFRFFTSISLVGTLLHNGIFSCGTIKCDSEGVPPELRNPDLRGGETLQMQHDQLLPTAWKDKKMVNIFDLVKQCKTIVKQRHITTAMLKLR